MTHGAGERLGRRAPWVVVGLLVAVLGCEAQSETGFVRIHNDFNNPAAARQPPWTLCQTAFMDVELGPVALGETSAEEEVPAGLDFVLMVAAWNDPTCAPENCLPIASRVEEEVVSGQHRTLSIGLTNHQGPCPPEGVQPIPEAQYERIRALWPQYDFKPYAERTQNPQCLD